MGNEIAELLDMFLKSTHFSYDGGFHQQKRGATMGSRVSAIVANLYMEFFKKLALSSASTRPRIWKHCVDFTFCVIE